MELPGTLTEGASLLENEYGWPPDIFLDVLANAALLGFACLGGQFQFRVPGSTCEMYWLNADSTDRLPTEAWDAYVARSAAEVRAAFIALLEATDFAAEAKRWSNVPELSGVEASPTQYLRFVAYFIADLSIPDQA